MKNKIDEPKEIDEDAKLDKLEFLINLAIWIVIIAFVCLFFLSFNKLSKKPIDIDYVDYYEYAYVQIGEKWQNFELEKHENHSSNQYKLFVTDGMILIVAKDKCILYNGTLLVESNDENKQEEL